MYDRKCYEKAVKALLCDIGGVLFLRGDKPKHACWEKRLGLHTGELAGYVWLSDASRRAEIGRAQPQEVWNALALLHSLDPEEAEQLAADFWEGELLNTRLLAYITSLRPAYKVAFLSNAWGDSREVLDRKYGFNSLADFIIYSAEVGLAKPDPEIFRLAVRLLEMDPGEIVFIDDNAENIEAAIHLGINGLLFTDTEAVIRALQNCFPL